MRTDDGTTAVEEARRSEVEEVKGAAGVRPLAGWVCFELQTVASRKKCESRKRGLEMKGREGWKKERRRMASERMERTLVNGRQVPRSQTAFHFTVRWSGGDFFAGRSWL